MTASSPLVSILLGFAMGPAGLSSPPEYQVKAAYVYNFAKFFEWPKSDLGALTVCIYGKDPFEGFLDEAVRGKLVHGLPIVVKRLAAGEENSEDCQVMFFGAAKAAQIEAMLTRLKGRSVVTIGEFDSFAKRGGMIGLVVEHGRVEFDINLAAIAAARLQASSRLVELGRVVNPRKAAAGISK